MNKYERIKHELSLGKEAKMKVFGNSMTPKIKSGSILTFKAFDNYDIGDVVFCKIGQKIIDAHLIVKKDRRKGYMIANNHGHENGWTTCIYGKVIKIE